MFEFIESRIYSKILKSKNIKSYSFQHSVVMTVHQTRFFTANTVIKMKTPQLLPDKIFLKDKLRLYHLNQVKLII